MRFCIETEREDDGRWIAEITDIPGVLAYGETEDQAKANAYALALRVIADQVEKSQEFPDSISVIRASAVSDWKSSEASEAGLHISTWELG